jgi:insecticidal toxin complex protein TccC
LQRWVSADPAGDVDGLNLYGFVGNNPLNYFDENGAERTPAELRASLNEYVSLLSVVSQRADRAIYQLYNMTRTRDIYKRSGLKLGFTAVSLSAQAVTATTAGMLAATATAPLGPVAAVAAVVAGAAAADITSNALDEASKNTRFGYPLLPGSGDFSLESLNKTANITPFSALEEVQELVSKYDPRTAEGIKETAIVAGVALADKGFKYASHLEKALGFLRLGIQVTEALNDSFGQRDLDVIRDELTALLSHLDEQEDLANVALTELENSGHEGEAAGTLKVLREAELVTSGKIIRVLDLTDRMSQYLMKRNAA